MDERQQSLTEADHVRWEYGFPVGGVAEEASDAYKDIVDVVDAAEQAGLPRKVARLEPKICLKG